MYRPSTAIGDVVEDIRDMTLEDIQERLEIDPWAALNLDQVSPFDSCKLTVELDRLHRVAGQPWPTLQHSFLGSFIRLLANWIAH